MFMVTCRTEGCENQDVPIEISSTSINPITGEVIPVVRVQCGPCGHAITDVVPPLPDEPYHSLPPEVIIDE